MFQSIRIEWGIVYESTDIKWNAEFNFDIAAYCFGMQSTIPKK